MCKPIIRKTAGRENASFYSTALYVCIFCFILEGRWGDENRDLFYLSVWDPSILIRFGEGFEVMKIVTFFIWLFEIPPFWSDLGGRVRWWKSWPLLSDCLRFLHSDQIWAEGWGDEIRDLFLSDFEIPQFWSDMGEGWGDGEVILSGCLRRFLHSDQIWGEVMKIVTFFYLTVWDSSILIRFEVRWWKSWPFSIWLFEIPPF